MKVSMHAISVGVVSALFVIMGFLSGDNIGAYISIALLLAGLVCTARMINNEHIPVEVYTGLFIGILAQLVAYLFI
jgi:hypothetical protein